MKEGGELKSLQEIKERVKRIELGGKEYREIKENENMEMKEENTGI